MLHMRPPGTGEPKKNSNAYMLFSTVMREAVKAESPGLTLGGVAKALGAKYKELSEEEKAHWQQKADEDKARRARPVHRAALSAPSSRALCCPAVSRLAPTGRGALPPGAVRARAGRVPQPGRRDGRRAEAQGQGAGTEGAAQAAGPEQAEGGAAG